MRLYLIFNINIYESIFYIKNQTSFNDIISFIVVLDFLQRK